MRRMLVFGTTLLLLLATAVAYLLIVRSPLLVTSRFVELERAQCINESALVDYGKGRFRAGYIRDVSNWIAQPAFQAANITFQILLASVSANIVICVVLIRKRNGK